MRGAGGGEVMLDPGVGGVSVGEAGPDVEWVGDGVGGGLGRLGIFLAACMDESPDMCSACAGACYQCRGRGLGRRRGSGPERDFV